MEVCCFQGVAGFFETCNSLEASAEAEVPLNIQDMWAIPKKVAHTHGVGLEDEDEDSEDEDLDWPGEVASSSSCDLRTQPAGSLPVTQA